MDDQTNRRLSGGGRLPTIEQFILEQQERFPGATGAFSRLLRDISLAAKMVSRDIRRAGLLDMSGSSGVTCRPACRGRSTISS